LFVFFSCLFVVYCFIFCLFFSFSFLFASRFLTDRSQDAWRLHPTVLPSFYLMQLEREEMLHSFIGSFLTGDVSFLPLPPNSSNNNIISNTLTFLPIGSAASEKDPRATTTFWRQALVSTCELFFLEQFLTWMQLFKYVPVEERKTLTPPAIVWHIWTLYSLTPSFSAAYESFTLRYLGRRFSITDCETIGKVDLCQDYRTFSPKQRYRRPEAVFTFPDEYEWRLSTFNHVLKLNGYADHFTWHPEACDPSCFGGRTRILMADGNLREIQHVREGDCVIAASSFVPRRVVAIRASFTGRKAMVRMQTSASDGFWITRGHPVWLAGSLNERKRNIPGTNDFSPISGLQDSVFSSLSCSWPTGEWVRPDEVCVVQWLNIEYVRGIYNLILEEDHDVFVFGEPPFVTVEASRFQDLVSGMNEGVGRRVSPVIACTLGRYCGERLARLHPHQNLRYGSNLLRLK
jgi:hypothetical protein